MIRVVFATVIVVLGATLVNWIRNGASFHIAKTLPLLGGFEMSIYDLAGGLMLLIAANGIAKLFRRSDS